MIALTNSVIGKASMIVSIIILMFMGFTQDAQALEGSITGIVLDKYGNNIPNATVKLLTDGQLVDSCANPQLTNVNASSYLFIGRYQFIGIPYGQYTVTAEKHDAAGILHTANLSVNLNSGTVTADIVIPDILVTAIGTASPVPTPSTVVEDKPTPASSPGFEAFIAIGGLATIVFFYRKTKTN